MQPFAGIIDTVKYGVPRVLFNWNAVGPFKNGKRSQDVVASGKHFVGQGAIFFKNFELLL